ncbi:SDR family NAD(P)-dependent oxidoreductase [Nonomuraea sp. NPDC000554]|uniref:SDR family NAD(P)-dependent oxidoreductase n=1 Tax=Nonomuraea sp. NPDC000554 TaxID=3154259 RepID=UPI0033245843
MGRRHHPPRPGRRRPRPTPRCICSATAHPPKDRQRTGSRTPPGTADDSPPSSRKLQNKDACGGRDPGIYAPSSSTPPSPSGTSGISPSCRSWPASATTRDSAKRPPPHHHRTGASSGIGAETARALARAGAEVTLAVRSLSQDIIAATGNKQIHIAVLDLADQASVAAFAAAWQGPLHILVNNAGIMGVPLTFSRQG